MILLDTHIWLNWLILGEGALPPGIRNAIVTADRIGVSAISCFEVTMLAGRGRIELPCETDAWLIKALIPSGIESLPVTCEISHRAVLLPEHHKDPADRLIIATALHHGARLASVDGMFASYSELTGCLLNQ